MSIKLYSDKTKKFYDYTNQGRRSLEQEENELKEREEAKLREEEERKAAEAKKKAEKDAAHKAVETAIEEAANKLEEYEKKYGTFFVRYSSGDKKSKAYFDIFDYLFKKNF